MTDHSARPERAATSAEERVAELHRLANADYANAARNQQPVTNVAQPLYGKAAIDVRDQLHQPTDLQVAVQVAQRLLDSDEILSVREALRMLLRALGAEPETRPARLSYPRRAVEADGTVHAARFTGRRTFITACAVYPAPTAERLDASSAQPVTCPGCRTATEDPAANDEPPAVRCPAAHPEDITPCDGPTVVTVLDKTGAGADGCEHHAGRLLASLEGGRVYPLPHAPAGAATRVFKAAAVTRPFSWGEGR